MQTKELVVITIKNGENVVSSTGEKRIVRTDRKGGKSIHYLGRSYPVELINSVPNVIIDQEKMLTPTKGLDGTTTLQ